jgi:DHA3 family multidrug efflux protein-like MFS transporter
VPQQFRRVLVNTLIANVTTSFLWFALTFWVYLGTRSVLATAIIGGSFMLLIALTGIPFGTFVDHTRKLGVMWVATLTALISFALAGGLYAAVGPAAILDLSGPWFWLFTGIILIGGVVENARNIALSTTVTILVEEEHRAQANGAVGAVHGVGFLVTSVFSGLAVGFLGMGWTIVIAVAGLALAAAHLVLVRIDEPEIVHDPTLSKVDLAGSLAAIAAVPGLMALIILACFNNLLGGVYMAFMDPYGLEMFSVQTWGLIYGVTATGFIVGGAVVSKVGLGPNPLRTMLTFLVVMGGIGALFTIREWGWLYIAGIWIYMCIIPAVEAAEQTVIQKVVPLPRQGRVFGFAQAVEAGAAPITAFLIGPIAEYWVIPWSRTDQGRAALAPLLGEGEMRGVALLFLVSGVVLAVVSALAFTSGFYRSLSEVLRRAPDEPVEAIMAP